MADPYRRARERLVTILELWFQGQSQAQLLGRERRPLDPRAILANAISREVEMSSANGEKPQSSQVPIRSGGSCRAAARIRSRTSSGVSTRGSIGSVTPMKTRAPGGKMLGDDGQDLFRLDLASQLDVEIARLELEQSRQQPGVVDVQAVRRILIAARAGVHSDAASLAVAETLEDLVVEGDEVAQDASAGVELEGEPPSVKSSWTTCAPASRALRMSASASSMRSRGTLGAGSGQGPRADRAGSARTER